MKTIIYNFILISLLTPIIVMASTIREIPRADLPDVAMASFDQYGPVIYYNPAVTKRIGPELSEFFRAHEYGHHYLEHIQKRAFFSNPYNRAWISQNFEHEADCYAVEKLPKEVSKIAIRFFEQQKSSRADLLHPTGIQRAIHMKSCLSMKLYCNMYNNPSYNTCN